MQKVLLVITQGCIGGAQRVVADLARGLSHQQIEATVAFGADQKEFLIHELQPLGIPFFTFAHLTRTFNPFTNIKFIFEIKRFLDAHKFDVVHFHSSNALFGAIGAKFSRTNPKTIFTFHGLSFLDRAHQTSIFMRVAYWLSFKFLLQFVDVPIFVNHVNMRAATAMRLISKGHVIPNGIAVSKFHLLNRDVARAKLSEKIGGAITKSQKIIGSIGRLAYPKNYEFLIRAFPEILRVAPNMVCCIIGDGPEYARYQSLIKSFNLTKNIFLVGAIHDAAHYMNAFDIFVLPSIYEGLSMTLLEAMATGIPIITTNIAGSAELVADSGLLYELNNTEKFVEDIRMLLENPKLRATLSARAKERSLAFTTDKMVGCYLAIYQHENTR